MKGQYWYILLIGLFITIIIGCSPTPTPTAISPPEPTVTLVPTVHPGKSVVNSKCIGCHDLGAVTHYKSDTDGWAHTVDQMILLGTKLSAEERQQTIDYLALSFPKD